MYDKRKLILSIFIAVVIAAVFWSQSRLPQLNEKAQMGERNTITALAFDTIYPAEITDNYPLKVLKTAINWGFTNWKGMAFGLLFAAALLCVFRYLPPWRPSKYTLINSLKGVITGVPLSVCVNCTTPIAYGMHRSGVNLVTVLSMLMSAPTLNIIVLTISFSLLPWHLATLKLLSSLIFILFFIPLLVKFIPPRLVKKDDSISKLSELQQAKGSADGCSFESASTSWVGASVQVLNSLWENSIVIVKMTLPLMLFAGLLGALLIEALPSTETHTMVFGLGALLIFALVGTLLPVPIAFDIIAVVSLLALGLPAGFAMALLFSLGIFSIYPALIIARHISVRLSLGLFVMTAIMAVAVGLAGQYLDDYVKQTNADSLLLQLNQQRSDEAMQILAQTCQQESSEALQESCFLTFLGSEYAATFMPQSCERVLDIDKDLIESCVKTTQFNQALALAKSNLDIQQCMALTDLEYQGKCWLDYAQHRALEPNALEYCAAFSNQQISKKCREDIVFYRVARIQNLSACEGLYSSAEKQGCQAHLTAMLASLDNNPASCDSLTGSNQINSCKKNVFLTVIKDQSDYQVCRQLHSDELIRQCQNYSNFDRAGKQNDSRYCAKISSPALKQRCMITAAHKKVTNRLTNPNMIETRLSQVNEATDSPTAKAEIPQAITTRLPLAWQPWYQDQDINIQFWQHEEPLSTGNSAFIKHAGSDVGLSHSAKFNFADFFEPFSYGRGIATGDVNNDHWPDVVMATSAGPAVFINKGNGTFARQAITNLPAPLLNTLLVALVDLNNDGWQDLFTSNYGGTNYIYWNKEGSFEHSNGLIEAAEGRIVTMATGFADWDKDGDLDYVAGNWSYGTQGAFNPEHSANHWLVNNGKGFDLQIPDELPGETLSVLLSDIDQDNNIDLLIANDREYPDHYYQGSQSGFKAKSDSTVLPITPLNNMSFESADFNNDLRLDVFAVDMSFAVSEQKDYCAGLADKTDRKYCSELIKGYRTIENIDINGCSLLQQSADKRSCLVSLAIQLANQERNPKFCQQIPDDMLWQRSLCDTLANRAIKKPSFSAKNYTPQKQQNVLLIRQPDGSLVDMAETMGATNTMWSWNAKAADLDNDQWQDIYVGNGFEFGTKNNEIHSNVFLHNQSGTNFIQAQDEFGLTDYTNTSNYSYADFDLDGDIDIVAGGSLSMPRLFINQQTTNNSISFLLKDNNGNQSCIGCKVTIRYGDNLHQIREIKLSGGFQSFDDPVVHFGLGKHSSITSVEIIWSTGTKTVVSKEFLAKRRYLIQRITRP